MATVVQDPFSTQGKEMKKKTSQPPHGALGWEGFLAPSEIEPSMEVKERGIEPQILGSISFNAPAESHPSPTTDVPVDPTPKPDILNEASQIAGAAWNTAGGLAQETLVDALDLGKMILGIGAENRPQQTPNILEQAGSVAQTADAETIASIEGWLRQIGTAQAKAETEKAVEESLRIVGREVTTKDAQAAGFSTNKKDLLTAATLHGIADKEAAVSRKIEEEETNVPIPSPAKQPSALEGAFEGRSGAQGSGTANLSAQAVG